MCMGPLCCCGGDMGASLGGGGGGGKPSRPADMLRPLVGVLFTDVIVGVL